MKKGISLITLIITIVVVIILAAVVILALGNNNPIDSARLSTVVNSKTNMEDCISIVASKKIAETEGKEQMSDIVKSIIDESVSEVKFTQDGTEKTIYRIAPDEFKSRLGIVVKETPNKDCIWYVDNAGKVYLVFDFMKNVPNYLKESNTTLNKSVKNFVIVLDSALESSIIENIEISKTEDTVGVGEDKNITLDLSKIEGLSYSKWVINESKEKLGVDDEAKYPNTVEGNSAAISLKSITNPGTYYLHVLVCTNDMKVEKISSAIVVEKKADVWDGSVATSFASGTGTEQDPYIIETGAQLAYLSTISYDNSSGKYYKLANNLDLNNKEWKPIYKFQGELDGNNYTIKNLFTEKSSNAGIFSYVYYGKVKNIKVVNATFNYMSNANFPYVGAIAAEAYYATFENCICKEINVKFKNIPDIGGIVGHANYSDFINCINYSDMTDNVTEGTTGGITGDDTSGKYTNCINYGNINTKTREVGGICGSDGGSSIYTRCCNFGDLSSKNKVGGISGYGSGSSFYYCFNRGNLESLGNTVGGLAPYGANKAENCYNTGKIKGTVELIAGLIGDYGGPTVNCYNIGELINPIERSGYITTLNAQSKTHSNIFYLDTLPKLYKDNYYAGNKWFGVSKTDEEFKKDYTESDSVAYIFNNGVTDDTRIWTIDASRNNGYPILMWELGIEEKK